MNHSNALPPNSLAEHRQLCADVQRDLGGALLARHKVSMREAEMAGVPVLIFTPEDSRPNCILLNLHGGGFTVDAGSVTENAAVAAYARMSVVAVLYRMAPEHPYPAAVEDSEAVYRALLAEYDPRHIGLYGTSAGACLCAQLLVRLKQAHCPLPGVFGFFSGTADLSRIGDSEYFHRPADTSPADTFLFPDYVGGADRLDPRVSPLFYDGKDAFPPTVCMAGTRDFMLSQTAIFHQSLYEAGVATQLHVHEAMPHAHWIFLDIPESDRAFKTMAAFLSERL